MDPRHESRELEILNEIIHFINHYIQQHAEEILAREKLRNDIKKIAKIIYHYAHKWIDVEGVFSNRNFLSIDVVLLPAITDVFISQSHFTEIVKNIESVIEKEKNGRELFKNIQKILASYDALI